MYTIHDFGDMIADRGRTDAYARAFRQRITPDSVVLDIGAGAGIMTLLACEAGARKVFSVESEGIIEVAREMVCANGYADRVEFIQNVSTAASLPEKVDVIVSEIHGVLPFYQASPVAILEARDRWLKPGGAMIPTVDTIMAAVVSMPHAHRDIAAAWTQYSQFDGESGRRRAVNAWRQQRCPADALLVEPARWLILDYAKYGDVSARGSVSWTVAQAGDGHGLCLWFDCETAPGCGFSNSPRSGEAHVFGQAFFPWPKPCRLEPGDHVDVDIRADLVGADYLWTWDTCVRSPGTNSTVKARYEQRQFASVPFSKDWLRKTASSFVPTPNEYAAVDKMILDSLVAGTRLDEIARRAAERFPDRFPDWRRALTRVGTLSMRYSK